MQIQEQMISEIAKEVVARLRVQMQQPQPTAVSATDGAALHDGVFLTVDEAANAAYEAQPKVAAMSLAEREKMISIVRRICGERCEELGRMEWEETGLGRLDHKIAKLKNIRLVLGTEALRSESRSDSSGICLTEYAPWGVIGMMLPATHSVPTMAANAINILAAGNTAVFGPHPRGCKVAQYALQLFNREIERECGVSNALTTTLIPTMESGAEIFHHPKIALLCVTGGPGVVKAASSSGKRVIAAGPGNPPVVVDETANLDRAAKSIIFGAAFDNNLLCIGEKEVFVVASVADTFIDAMRRAGAYQLDAPAIERLTRAAFTFDGKGGGCARANVNKKFVGKDVSVLAEAAGVRVPVGTDLLFGETEENHPFVVEEQMMPFLPIVRVKDADAGIAASVKAEHGYQHTAIIHTQNLETATRMARAMKTSIFVQNAPSTASLGMGGPGFLSHSIATPTGEGVTSPLTFTRIRKMIIGNALRII